MLTYQTAVLFGSRQAKSTSNNELKQYTGKDFMFTDFCPRKQEMF